jgi:hypothetical protein
MDKNTKKGIVISVIIIVVTVVLVAAILSTAPKGPYQGVEAGRQAFLDNPHTCPVCGWTGYVGLMNMSGGGLFQLTTYYCPECGKILGVI